MNSASDSSGQYQQPEDILFRSLVACGISPNQAIEMEWENLLPTEDEIISETVEKLTKSSEDSELLNQIVKPEWENLLDEFDQYISKTDEELKNTFEDNFINEHGSDALDSPVISEPLDNNIKQEENTSDDQLETTNTIVYVIAPLPEVEEEPFMLDPRFDISQYVHKDERRPNDPAIIKIDHLVKLQVSPTELENQDVLVAIYHSHPDFVSSTLEGISKEHLKNEIAPNNTPFYIKHESAMYRDVQIPSMNMNLKTALVRLHRESHIYIKFLLNSTDERNHGKLKDGREWHLLLIPLTEIRANEIRNSAFVPSLTNDDTIPYSIMRIQVKTEVRKNQLLNKAHRKVEVNWPLKPASRKRKRLEKEIIQRKMRKMAQMTDEEIEKLHAADI